MKILALGGKGFIGNSILLNLKDDEITFFERNKKSNLYEIKDLIQLLESTYDTIIVCSGSNNTNNEELFRSSVLNVQTILNNYRNIEKTQMIFFSSNVVDYTTELTFPYQKTKQICEGLLKDSKFLSLIILRIPVIKESKNFKIIKILSRFIRFDLEYNYLVSISEIQQRIEQSLIHKQRYQVVNFYEQKITFKDFNNKFKVPIIDIKFMKWVLFKLKLSSPYNKFKVFYGYR